MKNRYTHLLQRIFHRHSLHASMTVEASLVIPMVFFVWIACIGWTSVVYIHSSVQGMLTESARELAITAGKNTELVKNTGNIYAWLQNLRLSALESGIVEDIDDVNALGTYVLGSDDEIVLKVNYRVRLLNGVIPIPSLKLSNQVYVRAWTGGFSEEISNAERPAQRQVFVSEHGRVYHTDRMCSHIHVTIFYVEESKTQNYNACEKCIDGGMYFGQTYYITATGEHYHSRLGCSGLKRQVNAVVMTEAQTMGYRPCSRCGGGD